MSVRWRKNRRKRSCWRVRLLKMLKCCSVLALAAFLLPASAISENTKPEDITPRIGIIQVFGLQKLSANKIESSLGVKPGGPVPHADEEQSRLITLPGVVGGTVEPICCYSNQIVLYIGVEEKNSPHMVFRPPPASDVKLPQDLFDKYNAVIEATSESLHAHNADEDLTNGYSLLADPEGRALQAELLPMVAANLSAIDNTLRNSSDTDQRSAAAYLMQYAPRTPREVKTMTDALQYAIQDPDPAVRSAAMIALKAVLVGARLHPALHIHVEPTWFVELMNSTVWSDRHNASLALVTLTDKGNADTLALLRERALNSVCDMADWQDLEHALPGFILAGRLAGLDQKQIDTAWISGDRDSVIREARGDSHKKR